jgi:hypothetical protein
MSGMVAKRLLKKWLQNTKVEPGELRTALMMYEENNEIHLINVGLGLNPKTNRIEVCRVIQRINVDDAI